MFHYRNRAHINEINHITVKIFGVIIGQKISFELPSSVKIEFICLSVLGIPDSQNEKPGHVKKNFTKWKN